MSHNHDDLIFSWQNFRQSSPEIQAEILQEMDLDNSLPDLPYKQQAQTFNGAPAEIILRYLPRVAWEAQVLIWKNYLPVGARREAGVLLSQEARMRLKPHGRKQCLA